MNPDLRKRLKQVVGFPTTLETWPRKNGAKQIALHHTASGPGVDGDINWWKSDGQPVSTPVIIGRDGIIYQLYPTDRWAYHLGLKQADRAMVESLTVGIELDNWGWLTLKNGKYYSWAGTEIKPIDVRVLDVPYRGAKYFHKYTVEQIEATRLLLIHLGQKFKIDLKYKGQECWNLSANAKHAKIGGVYTHGSFRPDKTDIYPDPYIILMLKGLV